MTSRTLTHLQQGKQNQDTVLVCCHLFLPGQILQQTNRSIFDKNLVFLFDWRYLHLHIFLKYHFKVSFYSCLQAGGGHLYDPSPGKLTFHFSFGGGGQFSVEISLHRSMFTFWVCFEKSSWDKEAFEKPPPKVYLHQPASLFRICLK